MKNDFLNVIFATKLENELYTTIKVIRFSIE